MVLHVLRTLFVLLMGAVGWFYLQHPTQFFGSYTWLVMAMALAVAVFTVCVDILSPRRKLAIFSGTFFGLAVGLFITFAFSFVVRLVVEQQMPFPPDLTDRIGRETFLLRRNTIIDFVNQIIGLTSCYLAVAFILQTKDDFRFIIPFVEFAKQTRGARPILLDTSVLIDGRIADIAATGILESQLLIPRFVLEELQFIADSSDRLKRARGRRGLDVVAKLQGNKRVEVVFYEGNPREELASGTKVGEHDVDSLLLLLAKELSARVLTNDFNLNKVAQLRNVDVININQLATAVKPLVLPGEKMSVRIVKGGDQPGQGIGYLDDGTMVVVEHGRSHINHEVDFTVTSSIQNNTGKMIFGRLVDERTAQQQPVAPAPAPALAVPAADGGSQPSPTDVAPPAEAARPLPKPLPHKPAPAQQAKPTPKSRAS